MADRAKRAPKGRAGRLAAAEEMKSFKEKAKEKGSQLAAMEDEEDEDVFDMVDEKEYADVVEKRRQAGDFVVDDGTFLSNHR